MAVVVALLALGLAIFEEQLGARGAGGNLSDLFQRALGHDSAGSVETNWVLLGRYGLGLCAVVLSVVAWLRDESHRFAATGIGLAIVAIAWEYVLIALMVGLVIVVIGSMA
ncbi:MAG: hypothetical protein DHS20C11_15960 [Lysobacteraceae bacterium]|nr:MAG: hypothetical protein DHS20C11_15960 [Xanthomonadaceae bacterium]